MRKNYTVHIRTCEIAKNYRVIAGFQIGEPECSKLVQMWIKLQIRAKMRGEEKKEKKGGLGFFKLAIGFRKCLMPHDCCSFRGKRCMPQIGSFN